ncbi:hypothetical protein R1flu_001513 [Riccia fluitans]|uniref:AP2/ERF domain-containing protein n=1 Tax=Riccia fluitans TaxID=41844 RepID=A0ABD1Y3I0_9MARC
MESEAGMDAANLEVPSKGVRRRGDKWVAEIRNRRLKRGRHPGRKWLGTFSSAAEAREAYLHAVKKIKQPQITSRSSRVRRPQADDVSCSCRLSSSLFTRARSGARKRQESEDKEPHSRRSQRTGVQIGIVGHPSSNRQRKETSVLTDPTDSMEWNSEQAANLGAGLERKGVKRKVNNHPSVVSTKVSQSAVNFKSGIVTLKDASNASKELQQGRNLWSIPPNFFLTSSTEHCTSGSPSSPATSMFLDSEVKNECPVSSSRIKQCDPKQGDDSVSEIRESGPESAQPLTEMTERVPIPGSTGMVGDLSLFSYSSGIVLDDYVKFAADSRGVRHCALVDQALMPDLCPCSEMFIYNQKYCSSCICLWKHRKPCPLAESNPEENVERFAGHKKRRDYLCHADDMRIRTQNFSAFKTKQLISELEAELFVDTHPMGPQATATLSRIPLSSSSGARKGRERGFQNK